MGSEFPPDLRGLGNHVSEFGRELAKIVLPSPCICCARQLPFGDRVGSCCRQCWLSIRPLPLPTCGSCGTPMSSSRLLCLGCPTRSPLAWRESWGAFEEELRDVIHAWKFRQHDFLTPHLAELLAQAWYRRSRPPQDLCVPIPTSRRRSRDRGYDHTLLLARSFSRRTAIPLVPRALRRLRENQTQSLLPRSRRAENVRGVFGSSSLVEGRSVLLLDDIETTGETLRAAARVLRRWGAVEVAALTIARAL